MPHELTKTDNMFSASRVTPWHGLGTVVEDAVDSATAIQLAGLDWKVIQTPPNYTTGGNIREIPNTVVNYRSDNGDFLGIVSKRYKVIQNEEAFAFTDSLIGEGVRYETAGSLRGGKRVWLLARMPDYSVLGEAFTPFLLFSNEHSGGEAVRVCMTPVRVVCANTLNAALRGTARSWTFCHMGKIERKLAEARLTLQHAGTYMNELNRKADSLAVSKITEMEIHGFIKKMFPAEDTERKNNRVKREIERFRSCYIEDDVENFKGTKWGLLLAVSDYVTHKPIRTVRQRERHFSQMTEGHEWLDKAFALIEAM